jgi:hypothetical protein
MSTECNSQTHLFPGFGGNRSRGGSEPQPRAGCGMSAGIGDPETEARATSTR